MKYSSIRTLGLVTLLFMALTKVATADDVKDTIKRQFKVGAGGTLSFDLDRGNIDVEAISGDMVYIEMERIVDARDLDDAKEILNRHEVDFDQRGDDVIIESRFEEHRGRWGGYRGRDEFKLRVRARIPRDYSIHFTNGAGNISVADISGRVSGRTGAGNIDIGAVTREVDVVSGSGNIYIEGARNRVEVRTGAGNVTIREVQGEVEVSTGAGNVEAYITEQPREDSRLTSGAGNVTVYLGERIAVDVSAVASLGSASTDFPLRVEGKWMKKSFEGLVNGGGPELRMRSGVGNVALRRL